MAMLKSCILKMISHKSKCCKLESWLPLHPPKTCVNQTVFISTSSCQTTQNHHYSPSTSIHSQLVLKFGRIYLKEGQERIPEVRHTELVFQLEQRHLYPAGGSKRQIRSVPQRPTHLYALQLCHCSLEKVTV